MELQPRNRKPPPRLIEEKPKCGGRRKPPPDTCYKCGTATCDEAGVPLANVLLCDGCNREVHLACSGLDELPPDAEDFFCSVCLGEGDDESYASGEAAEEAPEESEEEEEEPVSEDEAPRKRKKAAKKAAPAKKRARTPWSITEAETGTVARPAGNVAAPLPGPWAPERSFSLGTVVAVRVKRTGRWVKGHVIMHLRGGVTTLYAVRGARVLFDKQQGPTLHYDDVDIASRAAADARLVRLAEPTRVVRMWSSGTPCMRNTDLEYAVPVAGEPDKARGFGASAEGGKKLTGKFSGGKDAAARLGRAEARARAALAAGEATEASVLACLAELGDHWPTQDRPNVTPNGKPVSGMCLGAVFVLGGVGMAVSNVSECFPAVTKLVTAWVRASLPEAFPFSSLQINYNYMAKKHVDGNNIGPSYIRAIGDHRGGELWTADKFLVGEDASGKTVIKGGGGEALLDCKASWALFNGNAEHYTKPYRAAPGGGPATRISFIAFSHQAYNKLSTAVAGKLRTLGFTAASDDGVDLPYFAKYRIDKKEFNADENLKYFAYQRTRGLELPPPERPNAVSIECYGLTMARGGGWMSHCDAAGAITVHELAPNTTGFHVLSLDAADAEKGVRLAGSYVDRKRFDIYSKTDPEVARFGKFVRGLKPGAVVCICITDTAVAAKRPPGPALYDTLRLLGAPAHVEKIGYRFPFAFMGVKGSAPGSATLLMDKTKFLLRIDATVVPGAAVALRDVKTEKTDITTKVIMADDDD